MNSNDALNKSTAKKKQHNDATHASENVEMTNFEKVIKNIWIAKPIWALNLNFDVADDNETLFKESGKVIIDEAVC